MTRELPFSVSMMRTGCPEKLESDLKAVTPMRDLLSDRYTYGDERED